MSEPTNSASGQETASSQAKIEANQRNALLSTGPTTEQGKQAAKGNATKYGLTSNQVVIEGIDGEDARERFATLLNSLRNQFAPEDPIGEFRVQRVAANIFRLERHDRAEAAMIKESNLRAAHDDLLCHFRFPGIFSEEPSEITAATEAKSHRIHLLVDRLDHLEEEIRRDRGLSPESLHSLVKLFGTSDPFAVECSVFCVTAHELDTEAKGETDNLSPNAATSMLEQATHLISEKRQQLRELEEILDRNEQLQRTAHRATLCVPSASDFEKLHRSRAAINKELEQDLSYLNNRPRNGKKTASAKQEPVS
jgi:hypothetical protein